MSQIVAEELRVPLERVAIRPIDTAFTPFDRSTGSSRSTTVMGKAVELASRDAISNARRMEGVFKERMTAGTAELRGRYPLRATGLCLAV